MISGTSPESKIQLTLTFSRLNTANSVIRTASATNPPVRAISRLERPWCSGVWGDALIACTILP